MIKSKPIFLPIVRDMLIYGEQESGGYSITVEDLYLTENAVYVKTCLIGPGAEVPNDGVKSYPYIVIKTEYLDYSVVFD